MSTLAGKNVAMLATNGFEESELASPKQALEEAGATVHIVSLAPGKIQAWKDGNWSDNYDVDRTVNEADANDYDALVIPGGVINPDRLRRSELAVAFVQDFFKQHKPVAAICHGPQLLIEARVVHERRLTSFPSVRTDLLNAGARWVDDEVVVDDGLVTSRTPADLPAFNAKLIEEVAEGKHVHQHA
ncbi:MAG TPA: type 1 glutamine amidotransferase domain-containing protein [Flavobacteriales bacterium]|nr:type 1 glutamine amidotransferase domain-containing protein [Flavobacteriales bacterium]